MISHCGFNLHFSDDWWQGASCIRLLAICMTSLQKSLLRSFAHLYIGFFSLGVEFYKFLTNFGYWPTIRYITDELVLPLSGFSLHFVDGFLCYAKTFQFDGSHICLFFLLFPLPMKIYQKKYCYEKCSRFYCLYFLLGFFMVSSLTFKSLIHFEFFLCMI